MYIIKFIIYTNSSWILFNTFPWLICCTPFLGGQVPGFSPHGELQLLGQQQKQTNSPQDSPNGLAAVWGLLLWGLPAFFNGRILQPLSAMEKQKWLFGVYRGWYYPTMWGYTKPIIRSLSSSQDSIGNYPMFFPGSYVTMINIPFRYKPIFKVLTSWMYSLHIWTGALKFVHQQWVAIRSTIDISIPKSTQGTFQAEGTCVYMARLSTSNFRGISPKATHTTKGFEHDTIDTICTWNPNDPCFDWKRPCFGGSTFKNRGHLGSRYIYIYICQTNLGTMMKLVIFMIIVILPYLSNIFLVCQ